MDPNYWAASLKYPPQSSSSRNDSFQPTLSSAGLGTNFPGLEQLLILERQRLASGFAANLLSHQQNLLGHAYTAGASTGAYPSNLLEAPGNQSLYAYAGALSQPYSTALSQSYTATVLSQPVFPGSFMSYDPQTSHGSSIESSGITTTSKSSATSTQKRTPSSDYNSLQRPVPVTVARTTTTSSSLNSSGKSGYSHQPSTQDKTHRPRDMLDLDSRYNSLSNFMDSTVASQNQTISANQAMSVNQAMSGNHSMFIHNMHSPTRRSVDATSNVVERSNLSALRTTPKANPNSPMTSSYLKSNVTSQRPDCNQRLTSTMSSGLDMLQFSGDVNAVDLTQFSKVLESSHHRKITEQSMSTIDTGDLLLGEYDINAARRAGGSSGGGSGQCAGGGGQSMHDTGGSSQWLLSAQQYASTPTVVVATVRGNQYEAITPPPPSAPHIFESIYPTTSQASQNFASDFVSASGYYPTASRSSGSGTIDSRLGIGTGGSSHKKPGESGVGIVLPMPQARELTTFDADSFDPLRYGGCTGSSGGGNQLQSNLYQSSNDQAITKLRDAMPLSGKQSFSTIAKDGSLSADSSQPIYLANINGNIYVNQYTMLQQPGGTLSDATIGDDYNPLTDFGIAAHGSVVYPTIDQAGYQSIVAEDVGGFDKGGGDCNEYKESDASSRSTMLVPNVNDQELGHLTLATSLSQKVMSHTPTSAIITSPQPADILRRPALEHHTSVASEVPPPTLSKLKTGNAFENSFLKFLCGEKTETLSSVTTSPIKNRPVMPKYIPEAPRRPPPHPSPPPQAETPVNTERVDGSVRPTKPTMKRKESSDGSMTADASNPLKSVKSMTSPIESGGSAGGVSTAPSPTAPRKFPAKFSHKMHNRSPTSTPVDNGNGAVKQSTPSASSSSLDTQKRPHNAAFESNASSSSKKRSGGGGTAGGDTTDPNNTQIQWTISKRDKMEVDKSSAHIPVLVIKAVPPSTESKETN